MMLWSENFVNDETVTIAAGTECLLDCQPGAVKELYIHGTLVVREGYYFNNVTVQGKGVIRPEHNTQSAQAAVVVNPRVISKLEFLDRFDDAVLATIIEASQQNAMLAVWVKKLDAATEVDLDSERVVGGLAALVASGLLTQAQADVVRP